MKERGKRRADYKTERVWTTGRLESYVCLIFNHLPLSSPHLISRKAIHRSVKTFSSKIWLNFKYFLYYALWESKLQGRWALVKGNLPTWLLFNEYLSLTDCRFLCLCGISCSSAPSKSSVSWSKQGSAWVLHFLALVASCIIIFTILQVTCLKCLLNVNCEQACTMCTEVKLWKRWEDHAFT